jgi:hypothetical protein
MSLLNASALEEAMVLPHRARREHHRRFRHLPKRKPPQVNGVPWKRTASRRCWLQNWNAVN